MEDVLQNPKKQQRNIQMHVGEEGELSWIGFSLLESSD